MANFVYLLADSKTKNALVADPGWDAPAVRRELDKEGWTLGGIILSHNHFDHIGGVGDILKFADVPIYIHRHDAPALAKEFAKNLKPFDGGEEIALGSLRLSFLHTPGHTEGSSCLQIADRLITGDTLFIGGCGRVDLPGSNPEKMYRTLKKIAALDESLLIMPGHNYASKTSAPLAEEKKNNPYLRCATSSTLEKFLNVVTG